ncbi:MAG TPA: PASTA domain-containing protein [Pyrinomonadaceae bacterium]|jgi:beta-lactam-binding protein with PASTA domain
MLSAFGKLGIVALIAVAFAFGLLTTIYLSLRSPNIQVPEVVNQSYFDGEKTLSKAGLDIRERAKRYKPGVQPGVILDQSPHSGDIVKAGQTVAVVVSRAPKEGEKPPDEAVIEERRDERGTEALDQNKNQNANRRRNDNRNANGNRNSNAANANSNAGGRAGNANNANAGNRNTNAARNSNLNANAARARNSNLGATNTRPRTTNSARPAGSNANRQPNP